VVVSATNSEYQTRVKASKTTEPNRKLAHISDVATSTGWFKVFIPLRFDDSIVDGYKRNTIIAVSAGGGGSVEVETKMEET